MINSIRDKRIQRDGLYQITLQVPEEDYFEVYDGINVEAAQEILGNFLSYHGDDGRPDNVDIKYNTNGHIVDITADLHYTGNDHTQLPFTPDMLNTTRRDQGKE
jgi:hypothetical protein